MKFNKRNNYQKKIKGIFEFIRREIKSQNRFNSKEYWHKRYILKGNSGSGSYGNLAVFKSKIINDFVELHNVNTVIELGCGDGNQLKLANYKDYIGFDVSTEAIRMCAKIFKDDNSKIFLNYSEIGNKKYKSELVLSLDVIFHLVEDKIFKKYMSNLFNLSSRYVIIYSSNYNKEIAPHVKCRKFTDWIDVEIKNRFKLVHFIPNLFPFDETLPDKTSFSDFYIYEKVEI